MFNTDPERPRRRFSRRDAIAAAGGLLTTGTAGCLGSAIPGDRSASSGVRAEGETDTATGAGDAPVVVASFFSFYDFARHVAAGTPVEVRNLVPTGLHGHGWEPNARITREIIEADAFIHVGPDFQPWADRAIETIEADGADTDLINARAGIDLVDLAASLDRDEEGVGEQRGKDPHFWLDPNRAMRSVDTIAEGLVRIAPDHEDALRANADAYKRDVLERIDAAYRRIFETADRDVVQLAAHNAFQYIGVTYDVRMRPLVVNLAASGDVKPTDITEAKRVIDEHDIEYIAAAVFETRRPAQQLLRETAVDAYFPVTPYAGVREDWVAEGWGYEEIARRINMPTFEVVLGNAVPEDVGPDGWADQWRNFE
ncbi:metal ABC transporter substrate-binding protein [Halopenitus sp. POP-27]|uniref:metal ABC transporter substrate-binding protein n=1 Tax=Halopenitus sp. POP-27 TaxID=2994425 RepID=UPI002469BD41|nr:metal ABC transporter substrate-binding protein [Halopenitus sp. POP-27]